MDELIDLHVHTTASDGTMSPKQIVSYAKQKGLIAIGITDHDTISGIEEAQKEGKLLGIEVIPGIEISTEFNGEMHILGYYIKETFQLIKKLNGIRDKREIRNVKIISKLNERGIDVSLEEVKEIAKGESIGRPHIAMVLMQKGYVDSVRTAFDKYLGKGKIAYVDREKVSPEEGIKIILEAGGLPVLAHPKYLNLSGAELDILLVKLKEYGLVGIEAYYSMNTKNETGIYLRVAIKHGLAVTGGTDFHGNNKPEIDIGTGKGNMKLKYDIVNNLLKKFTLS